MKKAGKQIKKIVAFMTAGIVCIFGIVFNGFAADTDVDSQSIGIPQEFDDILAQLPDRLRDALPQGIFSDDPDVFSESVGQMTGPAYLLKTVLELLGVKLQDSLALFCTCIGLVLLSALLRRLASMFGDAPHLRICNRLCILAALTGGSYAILSEVSAYFSQLTAFIGACIPVMGTLYAIGGNVGAAVANNAVLTSALTVCGIFCGKSILPVFGGCFALSLVDSLSQEINLSGVINLVKKTWMTVFGFLSLLLTASLSMQTLLATKSDSLGMKSAKYVAGNLIPVFGNTVAGTLGTLSASVELIRSSVGICGVLLLLLLLLPSLLHLLILRLVYMSIGAVSGLLACNEETALFNELTSLYGYLAGAACICTVVFLIAFALLCGCGTAF